MVLAHCCQDLLNLFISPTEAAIIPLKLFLMAVNPDFLVVHHIILKVDFKVTPLRFIPTIVIGVNLVNLIKIIMLIFVIIFVV